jgi:polyisoprenoid-binding protein YceI
MFRYAVTLALAGALTAGGPINPAPTAGSWQVDSHHSDVQLITDGTTDYGKKQVNFTYGVTRVNGLVKLDDADPANSKIDLHMYPATAMAPPIGEDGNSKNRWLSELANQTLICFHSKKVTRNSDGKLQVTGDLVLTRVDRNVEVNPGEDYKGPVYGPPMIHRVTREATFVFDVSGDANEKGGGLEASGSTTTTRESFPQLVKAVLNSYWPPVVQDKKCEVTSGGSEDYRGPRCTGTFVEAAGLPPAPVHLGEDYPGASNYNAVVGKQLTILVHMRLTPQTAGGQTASGM